MARIETLSAYKCKFSYLQRNNPLKEELRDKIKAGVPPEYTFSDFIDDFCEYTSLLAVGKVPNGLFHCQRKISISVQMKMR